MFIRVDRALKQLEAEGGGGGNANVRQVLIDLKVIYIEHKQELNKSFEDSIQILGSSDGDSEGKKAEIISLRYLYIQHMWINLRSFIAVKLLTLHMFYNLIFQMRF